jgi:hypothetical protein
MRVRAGGVAAGWAIAVAAATTVSWAGVSLAGDEVSPAGPAALSQAEVQRRIHQARTGSGASASTRTGSPSPGAGGAGSSGPGATGTGPGSAPAGSPPASGPVTPGPAVTQRSLVTPGGSVVLACTDDLLTARSSPTTGYGLSPDSEQTVTRAKIVFTDGTHTFEVEASCRAGVLTSKVGQESSGDD